MTRGGPSGEAPGRGIAVVLAALLVATGVVLAADAVSAGGPTDSFQQLVGGLGAGPAVGPGGCAFAIDPRLEGSCSANVGPVPGGACYCGRHSGLLSFPPNAGGGGHPSPD